MRRRAWYRPTVLWNAGVILLISGYLGWRTLRAWELSAFSRQVGYSGPANLFPIAFFRTRAPIGADASDVWQRMRGYATVRYYLAPIVGSRDSVLIQRFKYPMRWDDLSVDVEYAAGRVRDVDVAGESWTGMREIAEAEAFQRLGWRP